MTIGQLRELMQKAVANWGEDDAPRLAAALAFYAILALAPLLLFGISVASQFLDAGTLRQSLLQQTTDQLGSGASTLVKEMIESASKPGASAAAGAISLGLALLGASSLFGQLQQSVHAIWDIPPKKGSAIRNFVLSKLIAVVMALVFITLILTWIGIDSVISYMRGHTAAEMPLWPLVSFVVSVAFLTGVFSVTFKSLPSGMVAWSDVWIPAFLTACGFGVSKYLLSLYFGLSGVGAAYGPAGALVVILLWFYYSSQIFFFGVELTFTYAYAFGSHKNEETGELQRS